MYRPYSSSLTDPRPIMDVQSMIRNLAQDFVTSFNTGNYDQVSALFAQDGVLMVPQHDTAHGPKAVERLLHQIGEAGFEDLRLETVRVEASGDLAMEIGRYTVSIRQHDGSVLVDRGKYLKAWRRLGVWLIVADCWSSSMPVPFNTHGEIEHFPAA
jgi:ketosteroid isomerase-like protein